MAYKIAVIGATGNVGREMLNVLIQRQFPVSEVVGLASTRSVGTEVSFGDGVSTVDVDLATKLVTVSGAAIDDAAVVAAIDEAGYDAVPA